MRRERLTGGAKQRALGSTAAATATSAAAAGEEEGEEYDSLTVTTTERVHVHQMPLEISNVEYDRFRYLAYPPPTSTSRSVHSTTTVIGAGSMPLIGGVTRDGALLSGGLVACRKQRQTTSIITSTTTTYRVVEEAPLDDGSYDSAVAHSHLTIDIPLASDAAAAAASSANAFPYASHSNYVMIGSPTDSSMSPFTDEDENAGTLVGETRANASTRQRPPKGDFSESSFEFLEASTSSSDNELERIEHPQKSAQA